MKVKETVREIINRQQGEFNASDIYRGVTYEKRDFINIDRIKRALWQLSHAGEIVWLGEGKWKKHESCSHWLRKSWRRRSNRELFGDEYDLTVGVAS